MLAWKDTKQKHTNTQTHTQSERTRGGTPLLLESSARGVLGLQATATGLVLAPLAFGTQTLSGRKRLPAGEEWYLEKLSRR